MSIACLGPSRQATAHNCCGPTEGWVQLLVKTCPHVNFSRFVIDAHHASTQHSLLVASPWLGILSVQTQQEQHSIHTMLEFIVAARQAARLPHAVPRLAVQMKCVGLQEV